VNGNKKFCAADAEENELRTDHLPAIWNRSLPETLASLWASLPLLFEPLMTE
jgi:hypothetical protein